MSWTRRGFQILTTWVVAGAYVVFYVLALLFSDPAPSPVEAIAGGVRLSLVPLLWIVAARIALNRWWSGTGDRMSTMDPPARLLAAAVAALPGRRRDWGAAMAAELAEVHGRRDRWRFALSCLRATFRLPPAGGLPVLALVAVLTVAAAVAAGPAVGAAVPGLRVFAVSFTALLGAMVLLAVVRSRRPRLPVPTLLVAGGVAASIAAMAIFLLREPGTTEYLSPTAAVYVAVVLAGCLWFAVAAPQWPGASRLGPHLAAASAVLWVVWFVAYIRLDVMGIPEALRVLLAFALLPAPLAFLTLPAFMAGLGDRSFRSGLRAAAWTVTTILPLMFATWLLEGLHRHSIDGALLDGAVAPVGTNLSDARWAVAAVVVVGVPLGVFGAALAARMVNPPAAAPGPARRPV